MPTRDESKEATRRRILDAAREEFGRAGYQGASILSIARRAGITHPAIYRHFESKLEIFRALLALHRTRRLPDLSTVEAEPDAGRAIAQFVRKWLAGFREDADWARLVRLCLLNEDLYRALSHDADLFGDSARPNTEALVIRLVERLAAEGRLPAGADPVHDARQVLNVLKTVVTRRLLQFEEFRDPLTDDDVARAVVGYLTVGADAYSG